jgi:hypothetical protein
LIPRPQKKRRRNTALPRGRVRRPGPASVR